MSRDTNFYYSFLVLPARKRLAIVAVWDFCRAVDDAVDAPTAGRENETVRRELERWRSEVDRCFGSDEPRTKQGSRLKPHVTRLQLPRQPFDDLIDGVAMDVGDRRYETFADLYEYCLRVASAVGLICIEIFGYRDRATRDYAVALGVALQITNIIRDVPTDLAAGRIYLPLEDLRRFECDEQALHNGPSPRVRALLKFQCARAHHYFEKARATLPARDAASLVAAEIMGAIYLEMLKQIEGRDYDVFAEVARVPRPRRAVIAVTVWLRTMVRALATSVARVES